MRVITQKLKRSKGVATLELAMLLPIIAVLLLCLVQIIIYVQSATATQFAAFAAARSFQVYGDKKLADINYSHVRALPFTNGQQSIAEAAAEKVIFESLLWENRRIDTQGNYLSLNRTYEDGIQQTYDASNVLSNEGVVAVNFIGCNGGSGCEGGDGVEVRYCLPIVFPAAEALFSTSLKDWPCKGRRFGRDYQGLAITKKVMLAREPVAQ